MNAFMAGTRWNLLVQSKSRPREETQSKEDAKDEHIRSMPPAAPLLSVPFVSYDKHDLNTRIIQLGSLARSNDPTRSFWENSYIDSSIVVETIKTTELARGDILFVSREDALLSQIIRFWTQSPFNHAAIMKSSQVVIETYPNKGIISHKIDDFVSQIARDHIFLYDKPFGIWVIRLENVPLTFDYNLQTVAWDDYDAQSVIENIIHTGNSDGPDHPIPFPWYTSHIQDNDHVRHAKSWEMRKSFSCAELIARVHELDAYETFQWLPSSLFAKLLTLPGSRVMRVDTSEATRAVNEQVKKRLESFVADDDACYDIWPRSEASLELNQVSTRYK